MKDRISIWWRALRPAQWTKNGFVLMAWFFAFGDPSQAAVAAGWKPALAALAMAGSFCAVCSSFYLLNDVSDWEADRCHPVKRLRPVAAGLVSKIDAVRAALVLYALGMAFPSIAVALRPDRMVAYGTILAYTALQCLYSGFLKRVPYVDVVVIASGFVLRAVAGAAIIAARVSPWLLLCTFAISLFLALCKRRHEKTLVEERGGGSFREALDGYHPRLTDLLILLSAITTAAIYTCYTFFSETGRRCPMLALSSVWVAAGLARYLALVYRHEDVGRPERVLLTDPVLWAIFALYAATAVFAVVG